MSDSPNPSTGKTRIAVFASGNGSNFQALIDACKSGEINGEIVALVTNKRHAYAVTRARNAKIEVLLFEPEKFNSRTVMCAKTAKALNERNVDLVVLAGYMLKLEPCMVRSFPNKIVNIHPALLPKYGGKGMFGHHVHEAVLAAKETESGCSVHLVDEIYDHGQVLAQERVTVDPTDTPQTLAEKIHLKEHALYVSVVKRICSGELKLEKT
jgi:phosphoribosylglycinamide formyltransferase 1